MDPTSVPNNRFGVHILFPDEIQNASRVINSRGDWGYVTIPLQSGDRNLEKWQKFMSDAKTLHVIPIIRLANYAYTDFWLEPSLADVLDFANFLNTLDWPTKNRYVILFNEPNQAKEWGGRVDPSGYASLAWDAIDIFKSLSSEFFILNAGFDVSLPNSSDSMDAYSYLGLMENARPGIFQKFDAWNSHSYPNPNFTSGPLNKTRYGISSFEHELSFLQNNFSVYGKKVFVTETGWNQNVLPANLVADYFELAFKNIWNKDYIVAVTPFLLSANQGPFTKFSWMTNENKPNAIYQKISAMEKVNGMPSLNEGLSIKVDRSEEKSNWSAQKTNIWNKTSKEWIKKIIRFLAGQ